METIVVSRVFGCLSSYVFQFSYAVASACSPIEKTMVTLYVVEHLPIETFATNVGVDIVYESKGFSISYAVPRTETGASVVVIVTTNQIMHTKFAQHYHHQMHKHLF